MSAFGLRVDQIHARHVGDDRRGGQLGLRRHRRLHLVERLRPALALDQQAGIEQPGAGVGGVERHRALIGVLRRLPRQRRALGAERGGVAIDAPVVRRLRLQRDRLLRGLEAGLPVVGILRRLERLQLRHRLRESGEGFLLRVGRGWSGRGGRRRDGGGRRLCDGRRGRGRSEAQAGEDLLAHILHLRPALRRGAAAHVEGFSRDAVLDDHVEALRVVIAVAQAEEDALAFEIVGEDLPALPENLRIVERARIDELVVGPGEHQHRPAPGVHVGVGEGRVPRLAADAQFARLRIERAPARRGLEGEIAEPPGRPVRARRPRLRS